MKWLSLLVVLSSVSCKPMSEVPAPAPFGADSTPIGLPLSGFDGMRRVTQALDRLRLANSSMYGVRVSWNQIEATPRVVAFDTPEFEALDVVQDQYPELLGTFIVSIRVINVARRAMPADLTALPFNHPEVLSRMDNVIDVLASNPWAGQIDCILIGQESDTYLAEHSEEVGAFVQFLQNATNRIRARLPQASVATTVTFNGVRDRPDVTTPLIDASDWAVYTYYPLDLESPTLTMRPITDVGSDLNFLIGQAGNKPVAFWEIGYSSHPTNLGSQQTMSDFVREIFITLEPYRQMDQLRFVQYFMLHDFPTDLATQFAAQQGLTQPGALEYLTSLGLREYGNGGREKLAWATYVNLASNWADH